MNYDNITTSRKQFFFWEKKVQRFFQEHNINEFSDVDSRPEGTVIHVERGTDQ